MSRLPLGALPLLHLCAAAHANPVTNGGFETLTPAGMPADWSFLRAGSNVVAVTTDAHSGSRALLLKRVAPAGEVGFNRAPRALLPQLKGGLIFWYQAVSASADARLQFYAIPMGADGIEVAGGRAAFTVPPDHVRDGQWHRAALKYDFTDRPAVKSVHAACRLLGGNGELIVDDASYVERVGPLLNVKTVEIAEDAEKPGERGTLTAVVANTGDAAAVKAEAALQLPAGLKSPEPAVQPLPPLQVDADHTLRWTITGRRDHAAAVRVTAQAGESVAESRLSLKPDLQIASFTAERFLLWKESSTELALVVTNAGHAFTPLARATLSAERPARVASRAQLKIAPLPPGRTARLRWAARVDEPADHASLTVTVAGDGAPTSATANLVSLAKGRGDELVVANRRARMVFEPTAGGYGLCSIQVKRGMHWDTVARMARLGRVAWRDDAGTRREASFHGKLVDRGEFAAERDGWKLTARFVPAADQPLFGLRWTLTASSPRKLLAFEGPMIFAGEGTTGTAKTDAIFPGLEWLEGNEDSSSALDFAPDLPDRVRYVPSPFKVTIPLMAVRTPDATVGLLWRTLEAQPVFASPDRFEGRACHLMGLMWPTVADGLPENQRECVEPVTFPANTPRTIEAELFVQRDAADSLAVMDMWFKRHGAPEPAPMPRGTYIEELAFSLGAYLQTLWDDAEQGWWPYQGGPKLNYKVSPNPNFLFDLMMASRLLPERKPELSAKCLGRAKRVMDKHRVTPHADDLLFTFGEPLAGVDGWAQAACGLMRSQREDGSWRFDADRKDTGIFKGYDYHILGPDDAAELGTCARNAYVLLRLARITGDQQSLAAGLRAMKFTERFTVPRAAQVWEVPVHSPDILAAADAVDAYLEAYGLTGDAAHLAQAQRWARAGLPFLYVWNTPDRPWLRYASIPVFGATWMRGSWIGRPVQWNGLRYAYALLKLAPHAASFPWHRVAEGVIRSAMHQQSTDEKDCALWPDAINARDGKKAAWTFAPRLILKGVYRLIGHDEEPATLVVRRGPTPLLVTARARFLNARDENSRVSFDVEFPADEPGQVLLCGLERPREVIVDGKPATELLASDPRGMHVLRFDRDGRHGVRLEGVRSQAVEMQAPTATAIAFNFSRGLQGWRAAHDLDPLQIENGLLATRTTGNDPYLIRNHMRAAGDSVRTITVRMAVTGGGGGQFFWSADGDPGFSEGASVHFAVTADGQMHDYKLAVGDHARWRGRTITAVRLDPTGGPAGAVVRIESIRAE